jgi:hypothetical protein
MVEVAVVVGLPMAAAAQVDPVAAERVPGSQETNVGTAARKGKKGHWARECRKKKKDEQAHAAQVGEDEDPALLVACASVHTEPMPTSPTNVHLKEDKLFVQLGGKEGDSCKRWILDSGAMNHMIGERKSCLELDTRVDRTVHFGDGSVTSTEGRGTVLLQCKNVAHKVLARVYLIPHLTPK